jgi:hypothetical protein
MPICPGGEFAWPARLGHGSVAITADLYTHAVVRPDADAAERVQELIRKARLS